MSDPSMTLAATTRKRPGAGSTAMSHAPSDDQSAAITLPLIKDVLREFDRTNSYNSESEDYWRWYFSLLPDPPDFLTTSAVVNDPAFEISGQHDLSRVASSAGSNNPGQHNLSLSRPSTVYASSTSSTLAKWRLSHGLFVARLNALGIIDNLDEDNITPNDLSEIREVLCKPRPELKPSELKDDLRKVFDMPSRGVSERDWNLTCFHLIDGNESHKHPWQLDHLFDNLKTFEEGLIRPKPGIYYGSNIMDVNDRVVEDLESFIVPTTHVNGLVAPNFFLEMEPPVGGSLGARRQAMYACAAGAREIYHLQNYRRISHILDGNANTLAATFVDGFLEIFCMRPKASTQEVGRIDYDMFFVGAYSMIGEYISGAIAYRNARDWAKEH